MTDVARPSRDSFEPSDPDEPLEISADMVDVTAPASSSAAIQFASVRAARPAGLVDFERGMSMWPLFALVVIVLCTGVFVWQVASGALESPEAIVGAGALHRESVMDGELWRLFSATVLHAGVEHLLGNMGMLYILALGCEHGFGTARTAVLYVVSGLAGSLASLAMTQGPSVGASGAIFGMAAGLIVFLYRFRHRYFVRDKRIGIVLLIWAAWTVGIGFLSPGIDNWAHIGGFAGGAVAGALLPARHRRVPLAGTPAAVG